MVRGGYEGMEDLYIARGMYKSCYIPGRFRPSTFEFEFGVDGKEYSDTQQVQVNLHILNKTNAVLYRFYV